MHVVLISKGNNHMERIAQPASLPHPAIEAAPQRLAITAGPSTAEAPVDYERVAAEAAASADAHRAEREAVRGQADRNLAAQDEQFVADARETRDAKLRDEAYVDAYRQALKEQGGLTEDEGLMEERERIAAQAGHRAGEQAVERDHLWEAAYAAKIQELNAGKVVNPGDSSDVFNAAATEAADAAVAEYDRAHLPRADKMTDLQPFGEGAANGREKARKELEERAAAIEKRAEEARKESEEREAQLKEARAAAAAAAGGGAGGPGGPKGPQGPGQGGEGGGDGDDPTETFDAVDDEEFDDEDYEEDVDDEGVVTDQPQPEDRKKRRLTPWGAFTFGMKGGLKKAVDDSMRAVVIEGTARKRERAQRIGEMWHEIPKWKRVAYRIGDLATDAAVAYATYKLLGAAGGAIFGHDGGPADGGPAPDTTPDYTIGEFQVNEELSGGERYLWDGWEHANPDMSQGEIRDSLVGRLDMLRDAGFDVQMGGDVDKNGNITGDNWFVKDIVAPTDTAFVHGNDAETLDGRHFNTTAEKVGLLERAPEFDDGKMVEVDGQTIDQARDLEKEAEAKAQESMGPAHEQEKDEKDHNPVPAAPEANKDDGGLDPEEIVALAAGGLLAAGGAALWVRNSHRKIDQRTAELARQRQAALEAVEAEEAVEDEEPATTATPPPQAQAPQALTAEQVQQRREAFVTFVHDQLRPGEQVTVAELADRVVQRTNQPVDDAARQNLMNTLVAMAQARRLRATQDANGQLLLSR
jgi:hypothetical protein